jgi:hypothetical protein
MDGNPRRLADVAGAGTAKEVWLHGRVDRKTVSRAAITGRGARRFVEKYQRTPNPDLVRKIELLREEIEVRKPPVKASEVVYDPVPDRTGPALARMLPWWRRVILTSRRRISRSL